MLAWRYRPINRAVQSIVSNYIVTKLTGSPIA